ncbi:pyruvate kinase [Dunaliella salina]|uniref:Pyruvate kinase n=1 Tax=Dunaliella salina TaxID=3046 RepID=A0ABQ7GTI4_DUNSA|nr:pyruvate kinase [Dunaliella salina]|eukprot:KAF5837892.1 pyruvate kinase [Dunaliella salina]
MVMNSHSHSNLSNSSLSQGPSYGENLHSLPYPLHHPPHTASFADLMDKDLSREKGGEAMAFEPARQRYTAKTHFLPADMPLGDLLLKPDAGNRITASKVIATIGPSCQNVEDLYNMLLAGAGGFRVDLTWGPWDYHKRSLKNLEAACKQAKKLCCTVVDTLGRTIMVRRKCQLDEQGWPVHDGAIEVKQGQHLVLTTRTDVEASENVLPITYDGFADLVEKGDTFYIARYLVSGDDQASLYVEVQDVQGTDVICIAKNHATLDGLLTVFHTERSCNPALHVNRQSDLEVLSTYDQECLQVGISKRGAWQLGAYCLPYPYTDTHVHTQTPTHKRAHTHAHAGTLGLDRPPHTYTNSYLCDCPPHPYTNTNVHTSTPTHKHTHTHAHAGSLGLDCPPEKMAMVQKTLIQSCNLTGKPVLITRVVDTMQNSPRPTRAEATDVANAVLDGVDGILLGAETLRGKYPVDTVGIICDICRAAEGVFDHHQHFDAQAEAEEQLLEYKRTHADRGAAARMQLPPKPTKHKDLYHKILAYDMPAMENTMTSSLSTNCLNHTAEEVLEVQNSKC